MTIPESRHLTDEEFAESLSDAQPSPAVAAHLAMCALCRGELNVFLSSVDSFGSAALGWSKSQQVLSPRAAVSYRVRSSFSPQFGWAVACTLALIFSLLTVRHHGRGAMPSTGQAALVAPEDSPAQIAKDNRLMESVNVALETTEPSPFREYDLKSGLPKHSTSR